MPIKPLDMQVMIPKSSEVGKYQHHDIHKNNQEQFNLGIANDKKNDDKLKQVNEKEESNSVSLNKDENGRSNSKSGNKKGNKKQNSNDKKNNPMNCYKNGHFDVKI